MNVYPYLLFLGAGPSSGAVIPPASNVEAQPQSQNKQQQQQQQQAQPRRSSSPNIAVGAQYGSSPVDASIAASSHGVTIAPVRGRSVSLAALDICSSTNLGELIGVEANEGRDIQRISPGNISNGDSPLSPAGVRQINTVTTSRQRSSSMLGESNLAHWSPSNSHQPQRGSLRQSTGPDGLATILQRSPSTNRASLPLFSGGPQTPISKSTSLSSTNSGLPHGSPTFQPFTPTLTGTSILALGTGPDPFGLGPVALSVPNALNSNTPNTPSQRSLSLPIQQPAANRRSGRLFPDMFNNGDASAPVFSPKHGSTPSPAGLPISPGGGSLTPASPTFRNTNNTMGSSPNMFSIGTGITGSSNINNTNGVRRGTIEGGNGNVPSAAAGVAAAGELMPVNNRRYTYTAAAGSLLPGVNGGQPPVQQSVSASGSPTFISANRGSAGAAGVVSFATQVSPSLALPAASLNTNLPQTPGSNSNNRLRERLAAGGGGATSVSASSPVLAPTFAGKRASFTLTQPFNLATTSLSSISFPGGAGVSSPDGLQSPIELSSPQSAGSNGNNGTSNSASTIMGSPSNAGSRQILRSTSTFTSKRFSLTSASQLTQAVAQFSNPVATGLNRTTTLTLPMQQQGDEEDSVLPHSRRQSRVDTSTRPAPSTPSIHTLGSSPSLKPIGSTSTRLNPLIPLSRSSDSLPQWSLAATAPQITSGVYTGAATLSNITDNSGNNSGPQSSPSSHSSNSSGSLPPLSLATVPSIHTQSTDSGGNSSSPDDSHGFSPNTDIISSSPPSTIPLSGSFTSMRRCVSEPTEDITGGQQHQPHHTMMQHSPPSNVFLPKNTNGASLLRQSFGTHSATVTLQQA
jgi:hypothetical protein